MKIKWRILSICAISILVMAIISGIAILNNRARNKDVYATSLNFAGLVNGAKIYLNNDLIVNKSLVKIFPYNCTFLPEFSIKKSGDEESLTITNERVVFDEATKYTLTCKIKSSKNYYLKRSIVITVVESPTEDTSMYIQKIKDITLHVDDEIALSSIVRISCPTSAKIDIVYNENMYETNGMITAIQDGLGTMDITLSYDNIIIRKTIFITIKPKITQDDINLKLTVGGELLASNEIEIPYSDFAFAINYELTELDSQLINCWTNSDIIEITSYNSPMIVFEILNNGEATIFVSPQNYPNIVFEIIIKII